MNGRPRPADNRCRSRAGSSNVSTSLLKNLIAELTRSGCRVERLSHTPAVVTFRSPDDVQQAVALGDDGFRLWVLEGGAPLNAGSRFGTLGEIVRAACAA